MGKYVKPILVVLFLWFGAWFVGCSATSPNVKPGEILSDSREVRASLFERSVTDASLILVRVRLRAPVAELRGKFEDREFLFYPVQRPKTETISLESPSEEGMEYAGIFGVPYLFQPGKAKVRVEVGPPIGEILEVPFEVIAGDYKSESLSVDPTKVNPPKKALARIKREIQEVGSVYRMLTPEKLWKGPFRFPIESPVTSEFGTKRLYNGKMSGHHSGLDLKAAIGTPIYSSAGGTVALSKDLYYTGHTIIVDHGMGLFTLYAHMKKRSVKKGQTVKAGQKLGLSGMTGRVSGPHLHWGAIIHGVKINPTELVRVLK